MFDYRIDFESATWERPADGVRFKVARKDGAQIQPGGIYAGAIASAVVHRRHAGVVLEGTLEVTFAESVIRFEAGDGVFIPKAMRISTFHEPSPIPCGCYLLRRPSQHIA